MTSPGSMPASSAAVPDITSLTNAPLTLSRPSAAESSGRRLAIITPSCPRRTSPCSRICDVTTCTMLLGTAKPTPAFAPEGVMMELLMPTSRPSRSTSGPPELPRLMAASV